MEAMRLGGSPAMSLLVDLGQQCKTVRQLVVWLKKIGNDGALEILDYTGKYSFHIPVLIAMSFVLKSHQA